MDKREGISRFSAEERKAIQSLIYGGISRVSVEKAGRYYGREHPDKMAKIVMMLAEGRPYSSIKREINKRDLPTSFLVQVKYDYAQELGQLRDMLGRKWAEVAMLSQEVLEQALDGWVANKEHWEKENPDKPFPVQARDVKDLSVAGSVLNKMAMLGMGAATEIREERRTLSIEDAKAMRDALLGKPVEVVAEEVEAVEGESK